MLFRIARLIVPAALFAGAVHAQEITTLLERGIYLEETAGDLDGAIKVFRQVLTPGRAARVYAAQAQYHLDRCLLKQGHTTDTSVKATAGIRYVDPTVGYSITLPPGWSIHARPPHSGEGACGDLSSPNDEKVTITICAKPVRTLPEHIDSKLSAGEISAIAERKAKATGFTLRPGSPAIGWLAGQRSLTVVADNRDVNRTNWIIWVQTESTRASVSVVTASGKFEDVKMRLIPIIDTFRIP